MTKRTKEPATLEDLQKQVDVIESRMGDLRWELSMLDDDLHDVQDEIEKFPKTEDGDFDENERAAFERQSRLIKSRYGVWPKQIADWWTA